MTNHDSHDSSRTDTRLSRRGVLAAAGSALAAGLAGCSGVTQQSFAASPVVLPEADREELVLAETVRDAETVTRDGPSGNVEVEITNQASVYQRGRARGTPTVLERFTSMVNGTDGPGAAVVATAADLGVDVVCPDCEWVPSVEGDQVGLLVPSGARSTGGALMHGKLMAHVPGPAIDGGSLVYEGAGRGALLSGQDWVPDVYLFPDETHVPETVVSPDETVSPGNPAEFRVFLPEAEEKGYRDEGDGLPDGAEWVDPGQSIETAETVIAAPLADFGNPHDTLSANRVFDRAHPIPNWTASTFGLAALSTPDAQVAGQSVNPVVEMESRELLTDERVFGHLIGPNRLPTADEGVEWLAGPTSVDTSGWASTGGQSPFTLVGEETAAEHFVGMWNGDRGPMAVAVTVARATPDDHVVAAGAIHWPVGTADGGVGDAMTNNPLLADAAEFSASVAASLEVADEGM